MIFSLVGVRLLKLVEICRQMRFVIHPSSYSVSIFNELYNKLQEENCVSKLLGKLQRRCSSFGKKSLRTRSNKECYMLHVSNKHFLKWVEIQIISQLQIDYIS
jgi:hypothetical protein